MSDNSVWLEARSGRAAETISLWRGDSIAANIAWHEYAKSIGATKLFGFPEQKPSSFGFARNAVPEGWRKVSGRDGGIYVPRKRGRSAEEKKAIEKINADLDALPQPLTFDALMSDLGFPTAYRYSGEDQKGSARLGGFATYRPSWTSREGRILIAAPDFPQIFKDKQDAGYEVVPNRGGYSFPEEFEVLSREEAEFIQAGERLALTRQKTEKTA
ncbi:MAG: hypothetical protein ABJN42_15930 [Roseibium sp.]|uniref:hypothetical protein n=1 Tax=Roseibium sp. TaxID=1936156 RepID=UPI00329A2C1D